MLDIYGIYDNLLSVVAPIGHASARLEMISRLNDSYDTKVLRGGPDSILLRKAPPAGAPVVFITSASTWGLDVSHIDEKGFLKFSHAPAEPASCLEGKRVRFENGCVGVIARDGETDTALPASELRAEHLYIDIGARNAADAEKLVKRGEGGILAVELAKTGGCSLISPYLGDLAGCVVLLSIMQRQEDVNASFVFTSTPGHIPKAVLDISPKVIIYIDATAAGGVYAKGKMNIGDGAAFHSPAANPLCGERLAKSITQAAEEQRIPLQSCFAASDLASPHVGAPVVRISVPIRNLGTAAEMVRAADLESCVALALLGAGEKSP